jgi:DNA-binding MurR/RpiR family transcriptional regulator
MVIDINSIEVDLEQEMVRRLPDMRPSERSVVELLLNEPSSRDLNLEQLAERAAVSASSVTRMCKMLGFSGFRTFRLRWIQESVARKPDPTPERRLFASILSLVDSTERLIAPNLSEAAQVILNTKQTFLFASAGTGTMVADQAAYGLRVAGQFAVSLPSDKETTTFTDETISLLVLSHRGNNQQIESIVRHAKANGSPTIVLTGDAGSKLARQADVLLLTERPLQPNGQPDWVAVRLLQFAAVYALVREIESKK